MGHCLFMGLFDKDEKKYIISALNNLFIFIELCALALPPNSFICVPEGLFFSLFVFIQFVNSRSGKFCALFSKQGSHHD